MAKKIAPKTPIVTDKAYDLTHADGPFTQSNFFKKYGIASLIITALCFGIYFISTSYGYVLDDQMVITNNKFTNKGTSGIYDLLSKESFEGYFGEQKNLVQGNRYRPASMVTFALEKELIGQNDPAFGHLVNIILYAVTCILLLLCLHMAFRNYKSPWYLSIPFIATLIYASMPIHVEAVANIKGRDEIMSMLFSLWALYCSMKYVDGKKMVWLIGCGATFFLGLMSKENALTFLAIIPLSIYFFSNQKGAEIRKVALSLLVVSIGFMILRQSVVGQFIGKPATDIMNNPFLDMTGLQKMGSIFYSMIKYIGLMIFPISLSHDYYPYQIPKTSIFAIIPILSLVLYSVLAYVAWRGWKSKSVYAYAILFYFSALSIVSNIVINIGTFMNERFIFMASAGFAIGLAYFLMHELPNRWKISHTVALGIALVMTFGYSWKSFDRVPDWQNASTLNRSAVEASPNSARANSFLATALFEKYKVLSANDSTAENSRNMNKLLDSIELYSQKSVEIIPDYYNGNLMLCGVASERFKFNGDIQKYIKTMKPVIMMRPDISFINEFSQYLSTTNNSEALFSFYREIGLELLKVKGNRKQWAFQYLSYAYDINKTDKGVMLGLAEVYYAQGKQTEADQLTQMAQKIQ